MHGRMIISYEENSITKRGRVDRIWGTSLLEAMYWEAGGAKADLSALGVNLPSGQTWSMEAVVKGGFEMEIHKVFEDFEIHSNGNELTILWGNSSALEVRARVEVPFSDNVPHTIRFESDVLSGHKIYVDGVQASPEYDVGYGGDAMNMSNLIPADTWSLGDEFLSIVSLKFWTAVPALKIDVEFIQAGLPVIIDQVNAVAGSRGDGIPGTVYDPDPDWKEVTAVYVAEDAGQWKNAYKGR